MDSKTFIILIYDVLDNIYIKERAIHTYKLFINSPKVLYLA